MTKPVSVEQYKLVTSFESVRKTLLTKKDQRLARPLAYWALPNDRRLPLALLDKSLNDLLAQPFDELSATPGIGQKKMGAMIKLLLRAANEPVHDIPFGIADLAEDEESTETTIVTPSGFDPSTVSESQWSRWTQTVARHGLLEEKLGRLAPSLTHLPTVIWDRPLGFYSNYTIAEIRKLKTHGEKRVAVILEVFHEADRLLANVPTAGTLTIRLLPKFVQKVEAAIETAMTAEELPDSEFVRKEIVAPLLRQTKVDLGEMIQKLCEARIGPRGKPQSVKSQSRRLGVTRARIYQLVDECAMAFSVRWPQGRCQLDALKQRYEREEQHPEALRLLDAARQICFPQKLEGEQADEAED